MTHLWEHSHPYYATQGCYYVSSILGTRDGLGGYNGSTCHIDYASWDDFKAGKAMSLSAEALQMRRENGIDDAKLEAEAKRWAETVGPSSMYTADKDYNLLYRWDWKEADPADYEEGEEMRAPWLELFYMLQRKAKPLSVEVHDMRPEDEPEVRAFLQEHWDHMQRVWAPFGTPATHRQQRTQERKP
jgi:hypothetical protein